MKKSRFNPVAKHAPKFNRAATITPKKIKEKNSKLTKRDVDDMIEESDTAPSFSKEEIDKIVKKVLRKINEQT